MQYLAETEQAKGLNKRVEDNEKMVKESLENAPVNKTPSALREEGFICLASARAALSKSLESERDPAQINEVKSSINKIDQIIKSTDFCSSYRGRSIKQFILSDYEALIGNCIEYGLAVLKNGYTPQMQSALVDMLIFHTACAGDLVAMIDDQTVRNHGLDQTIVDEQGDFEKVWAFAACSAIASNLKETGVLGAIGKHMEARDFATDSYMGSERVVNILKDEGYRILVKNVE